MKVKEVKYGKRNIAAGLFFMAGFMAYGFALIYMRDFAPDKVAWIADANNGTHFEARLAHVHGNLFALLNIVFGFLLMYLPVPAKKANIISWTILLGMLMPLGIMGEFLLGLPPIFVVLGAISIVFGTAYFGWTVKGLNSAASRE